MGGVDSTTVVVRRVVLNEAVVQSHVGGVSVDATAELGMIVLDDAVEDAWFLMTLGRV